MKKTIETLLQKLTENEEGKYIGGYGVIRGGLRSLRSELNNGQDCSNSFSCTTTNQNTCTNSGSCQDSTNLGGCTNSGACLI